MPRIDKVTIAVALFQIGLIFASWRAISGISECEHRHFAEYNQNDAIELGEIWLSYAPLNGNCLAVSKDGQERVIGKLNAGFGF